MFPVGLAFSGKTDNASFELNTILSNKLTPWSRAFIENLTVAQLPMKFTSLYETEMSVHMFIRAIHVIRW